MALMRESDSRQRASGWRAIVPVALHGASTSTRSIVSAKTGAKRASAAAFHTYGAVRFRFCRSRSMRPSETSDARTVPYAASRAALPPGAAHASHTRAPDKGAATKSNSWRCVESCTMNPPSA